MDHHEIAELEQRNSFTLYIHSQMVFIHIFIMIIIEKIKITLYILNIYRNKEYNVYINTYILLIYSHGSSIIKVKKLLILKIVLQ